MTRLSILDVLQSPDGLALEQRFWSHVHKRRLDECWEWTASRVDFGYGRIVIAGTERLAHQVSFAIRYGWKPPAVLHKCDNPPCVNPHHLFGGTQADNCRDAAAKWRTAGKITPASRSTIFALRECGLTHRAIANQIGVSRATIARTLNGELHTAPDPVSA
jgi:hypothetical protein